MAQEKIVFTPDIVNNLNPPMEGEVWIGHAHIKHFGLRLWAGKEGGGKAFAIRLRDQKGVLKRETYSPSEEFLQYSWHEGWNKALGYFLGDATRWACNRISIHQGLPSHDDLKKNHKDNRKQKILNKTIESALEKELSRLERKAKHYIFTDQIRNLIWQNISSDILKSTFENVDLKKFADEISSKNLSFYNVKSLQRFVCKIFHRANEYYPPLKNNGDIIRDICSNNLQRRKEPPFPEILEITSRDLSKLFSLLESNKNWRAALAIRLYFATGAKMQQVLKARWSDIIDGYWYPFTPAERKLWFESIEFMKNNESSSVLSLIIKHHKDENINAPYLFPSLKEQGFKPIKTIQRSWDQMCSTMGWSKLPLSHVVLRYKKRNNPSYSLSFNKRLSISLRDTTMYKGVSKVGKRRKDNSINAMNYC